MDCCAGLELLQEDKPRPRAEKPRKTVGAGAAAGQHLNDFEENTPRPKAKEKPQQNSRRVNTVFWIKPHTR